MTFVITKFLFNNSPAADRPPPFPVETISDGHDAGGFLSSVSVSEYHDLLERVGSQTLRDLLRRLDDAGRRFDAMVYDILMPWVLEVGKEWRLKTAVYFTQSCAVNNIYFHVYRGEIKLPLVATKVIQIGGMPSLTTAEVPSLVKDVKSYPGFLALVINQFRNVEEADWLMCNSFYEQEQQLSSANLPLHLRAFLITIVLVRKEQERPFMFRSEEDSPKNGLFFRSKPLLPHNRCGYSTRWWQNGMRKTCHKNNNIVLKKNNNKVETMKYGVTPLWRRRREIKHIWFWLILALHFFWGLRNITSSSGSSLNLNILMQH